MSRAAHFCPTATAIIDVYNADIRRGDFAAGTRTLGRYDAHIDQCKECRLGNH